MAYEIANADGPIDQFASNQGYADLIAATHASKYPALRSLLDHGASEHVPEVVEDLDALIDASDDDSVAHTAEGLRDLIDGQKLIVITDGTGE
jgi:hypothetical protein